MNLGRALILFVLGLGVAGFGICSLCGGVAGLSMLFEGGNSREIAWLAFGISGVGLLIAWGCWRGLQAVRRGSGHTPPRA